MLDYRAIEKRIDWYADQLKRRGFTLQKEEFSRLATSRRRLIQSVEELRARLKDGSKQFGMVASKHGKDSPELAKLRAESESMKSQLTAQEAQLEGLEKEFNDFMLVIPNIPSERTPDGKDANDNVVIGQHNPKPAFSFTPRDHTELGQAMGIFDFDRAAKLSGARFVVLRGAGAVLERAIATYLIDSARARGYEEVSVPYMVKREIMVGTGQLPKFEADLFRIDFGDREWFLVPTAEVPVTNLHAGEILDPKSLPRRYTSFTHCFRGEAGSYGRDTKGIIRQHQFSKVELVHFCTEEQWPGEYEKLLASARACLDGLGLHYQVVSLCAADMGFAATQCYDLEVWLPGQNAFREISSCSHFGDYQGRRAKIRTRTGDETVPVHTLNGSALPIGRTLVAVMEQYQQPDGSVVIPEALRKYTGFEKILANGTPQ